MSVKRKTITKIEPIFEKDGEAFDIQAWSDDLKRKGGANADR